MVSTDAAQYVAPFVTPLAGLWVIHNAIFSSPGFVNKMRGTIVSGVYEKEKFTREHARALLIDWALCVIATVVVCFIPKEYRDSLAARLTRHGRITGCLST